MDNLQTFKIGIQNFPPSHVPKHIHSSLSTLVTSIHFITSRLVLEKCQTAPRSDCSHVPALAHGQRFEADAREYYESKYGVLIEVRGLHASTYSPLIGS